MQTYTHFIITAVLNRNLRRGQTAGENRTALPPLRSKPLLWGSVAPDIPLILMAVSAMTADLVLGNRWGHEESGASYTHYLFSYLYFNDPWVKSAQNLFHAPFLVAAYILVGYWAWRKARAWGPGLFWFGIACLIHTTIDIAVHHDDGPLLLFPFDLTTRFHSPVSYYHPEFYGRQFTLFEHTLALAMLIYLVWGWWRDRQARIVVQQAGTD